MKKIRRRDGSIAVVSDDYVIQDGESFTIPLAMMDAKPRMVTDSRGNPAGCRPGFLYADSNGADAVLETAHKEYRDAIEARWRSDRWSGPPSKPAPVRPQTFDSQSVDAAYETYRTDIENRWRR